MKNKRIWNYPTIFLGVILILTHSCTYDVEPLPVPIVYAAIAAGEQYSLALKTDSTIWAWGDNSSGQLGDGTVTDRNSPVKIDFGYSAIAAGYYHSLALKTNGTLWAWGDNSFGELGDGTYENK